MIEEVEEEKVDKYGTRSFTICIYEVSLEIK